jgi:hypothetical protein
LGRPSPWGNQMQHRHPTRPSPCESWCDSFLSLALSISLSLALALSLSLPLPLSISLSHAYHSLSPSLFTVFSFHSLPFWRLKGNFRLSRSRCVNVTNSGLPSLPRRYLPAVHRCFTGWHWVWICWQDPLVLQSGATLFCHVCWGVLCWKTKREMKLVHTMESGRRLWIIFWSVRVSVCVDVFLFACAGVCRCLLSKGPSNCM